MSTIRDGNRAALVVVDTQVGVVATAHNRDAVVGHIGELVAKARQGGVPVVWVQHEGEELVKGQPDWQIVPELQPASGEILVPKNFNSAFQKTSLAELLAKADVSHLMLCGAATNWCIRATAFSALDRGYDLTLAGDAHSTDSIELGPDRVIAAADIIAELNVGLNWVEFPGVKNQVRKTAEIGFDQGSVM